MKITTTILEIITSDFNNKKYSEFYEGDTVDFAGGELNYMARIAQFNHDTYQFITRSLFKSFKFNNDIADYQFKKMFTNHFLNREIKFQTVDTFKNELVYQSLAYEVYLTELFVNYDKMFRGLTESQTQQNQENEQKQKNETDDRHAVATLPQSDINLNVADNILTTADTNDIAKRRSDTNITGNAQANTNTTTQKYSLDEVMKYKNLIDDVFYRFDKHLFLGVF